MPRSSKPDPDDPAACERAAVALLARREHTRRELTRKLAARAFRPDVVAATLDRLEQAGLLDGRRFAESYVASRAARGYGPAKIRAELLDRGLDPASASAALDACGEDWRARARSVRRKRFGAGAPKDFKARARQARFLQYRGFDQEQIDAALDLQEDYD